MNELEVVERAMLEFSELGGLNRCGATRFINPPLVGLLQNGLEVLTAGSFSADQW